MATPYSIARPGQRSARFDVPGLVFVALPQESAFVLNLSENGMAIQAMEVLQPGHSIPFSFPLPETTEEVQGTARIVWTDRSGRAGLEFTDVSEFERFQLKQWVRQHQN